MPIKFAPKYEITTEIASFLMRIETAREAVLHLPMTPFVMASLRETARLFTTHYSTMIEGNQLQPEEIEKVLHQKEHFAGRVREENEVKGYYTALRQIEEWVRKKVSINEARIQTLHAFVMGNGRSEVKPTPYRDGQNVIRDSSTRAIVYMPPEGKDVPVLMQELVNWLNESHPIPTPLVAAIAHYQFATIHPYYDGNGRTARLLTTLILHLGGYDLKGLYSLEEYYAKELGAYYDAIQIGPSHNYYLGRAESDITKWIRYFLKGMTNSFENVLMQMRIAEGSGEQDQAELLRQLDPKQRKALELFSRFQRITAHEIGELFGFKPRTSSQLCKKWVEEGFLEIVQKANKNRNYQLGRKYCQVLFLKNW